MKKAWTRVKLITTWGVMMLLSMLSAGVAFAAPGGEQGGGGGGGGGTTTPETSILPADAGIGGVLKIFLNVLVYGLGAAAVLSFVVAGIQYMTARDNEGQVKAAKQRIYNTLIGIVAWAAMWALLNWLIPGGLNFDNIENLDS